MARSLLRSMLVTALAAGSPGLLAEPADAQAAKTQRSAKRQEAPQPARIDRNGVLILVRGALLALDQANKTGNYTVLRDLGAPGFQQANTAARLAEVFASQRQQKLDLGGVAALDPQLTLMPQVEPNGMLHMAGFFPSVPTQVNFELLFAPADRQWKLFGLSVNLSDAAPQAPPETAEQSPPVPQEKPVPPTAEVNPQRLQ